MPAVQTCGVDIDDENQGKSWNEGVKNGTDSTISKVGRGRWNAGGGRKGGEDERRLGLMRDCMMQRPLSAVFCHPRAAANDGGGGSSVEDSTSAFSAVPCLPTQQRSGSGGGADDAVLASSAGHPSLACTMMATTVAASARTRVPRLCRTSLSNPRDDKDDGGGGVDDGALASLAVPCLPARRRQQRQQQCRQRCLGIVHRPEAFAVMEPPLLLTMTTRPLSCGCGAC